jgi:hypothetical protein
MAVFFKNSIYLFSLIGLILGISIDYLIHQQNHQLFYYLFISLFFLFYALAYNGRHLIRLIGTSILTALVLSIPFLTVNDTLFKLNLHFFIFCYAFPCCAYIAHSFHYGFHHDNTLRINYSTLFEVVWTTIPLIITALLFGALVNGLIVLAALIFKTVGNEYLWDLYFNNWDFTFISNIVFFFMGLSIVQQNIQLIYNLRFLLLKMMYYLFPILAIISILYALLYSVNLLTGGQSTVEPLLILVPITSLGIIFFNAYFQDGSGDMVYHYLLDIFLRIYRVALLLLSLIMTYKVFQLTSVDINLFMTLLAVVAFTLTYALTAFLGKNKENIWIYRGNIAAALFFLIAMIVLNLPYIPVETNISFF